MSGVNFSRYFILDSFAPCIKKLDKLTLHILIKELREEVTRIGLDGDVDS
jgi:hypothetical protein